MDHEEKTTEEAFDITETAAHHHHHHHHTSDGSHSRSHSQSHSDSHSGEHHHHHHHSRPVSGGGEDPAEMRTVQTAEGPALPHEHHHRHHSGGSRPHAARQPVGSGDPGVLATAETVAGPTAVDSRKSSSTEKSSGGKLRRFYKRMLHRLHLKTWQLLLILGLLLLLAGLLIYFLTRPVHSHSFGEWTTVREPTCESEGLQRHTCACGAAEDRSLPIVHDFVYAGINPAGKTAGESARTVCTRCGREATAVITAEEFGLPILWLEGDLDNVVKDEDTPIRVVYEEADRRIESEAEIHLQGASSASRPKKNYSLHLLDPDGSGNKVTLREDWGKQSKYCLKADYMDSSAARNLVTASLYGEISENGGYDDRYASLVNAGAVDGYPVAVYLNGRFNGCYSLNIPKNKWLFGMESSEETREAILYARNWSESTALREEMKEDITRSGWDLEFCSTENTDWVRESFNRLIAFVNESDDETFRARLGEYIGVDRTIDTMLLTMAMGGVDNLSKNILWTTYDGTVWTCTPYDLDATWGLSWRGRTVRAADLADDVLPPLNTGNSNLLWKRLWKNFRPEIVARYRELREEIFTVGHITALFEAQMALTPDAAREANRARWTDEECPDSASLPLIRQFIEDSLTQMDAVMTN